ncbi:MAG: hypothetical protein P8Y97_14835 [Candidatus Lokiarchaeota archaeon]
MSREKVRFKEESNPLEKLCYVYIMYFDESKGHIPLLIYPSESFKDNKEFMRPIKYHPIWFLEVEETEALDHIDLEYKGYTFFGKKFLTKSIRKKRRAGLDDETPETIVVIISLPNKLDIFGDELIEKISRKIRTNYDEKLYEVIECEIAKEEVIKSAKVKECIGKGEKIKEDITEMIKKTCKEYFSSVIQKEDSSSIKKQKAISFLALKGIDVSHIFPDEDLSFSNIKIFDPTKKDQDLVLKRPFKIGSINIMEDSQELEILVKNQTQKEYNNIRIKITHVREFFEKEIMNQTIDQWFPEEELLFISPIIPHIQEYLFFIIEKDNKEILLSKKIDIDLLKN